MGLNEQCEYTPQNVLREALCEVLQGPHHVRVVQDIQGPPASCPSTGVYVRLMTVQAVNINDADVTDFFSVSESLSGISNNSCGTGQPQGSICAPADSGGQFTDIMAVTGNFCGSGINRNSGCGYTLTSNWSWCGLLGPVDLRSIWSYAGETRSNVIRVNGQTQYPSGTYLYGSGGSGP